MNITPIPLVQTKIVITIIQSETFIPTLILNVSLKMINRILKKNGCLINGHFKYKTKKKISMIFLS